MVYQRAGEIWLLESLDAEPVRLDIRLSGVRSGRALYPVPAKPQLGSFTLDSTGRLLGAEVRGTVHWLPGRDGPARALLAEPGGRATVVGTRTWGGVRGVDLKVRAGRWDPGGPAEVRLMVCRRRLGAGHARRSAHHLTRRFRDH